MRYIKQILLLYNREIVQNNSPRWLETVGLYFPRLRLGKYSSPRSPVTSGSYFAQFPSWAVNICILTRLLRIGTDLRLTAFPHNTHVEHLAQCSIYCRTVALQWVIHLKQLQLWSHKFYSPHWPTQHSDQYQGVHDVGYSLSQWFSSYWSKCAKYYFDQ